MSTLYVCTCEAISIRLERLLCGPRIFCMSSAISVFYWKYLYVWGNHQYSIRKSILPTKIILNFCGRDYYQYLGVFCITLAAITILEYFACLVRGPPSAGICLVRSASCCLAEAGAAHSTRRARLCPM